MLQPVECYQNLQLLFIKPVWASALCSPASFSSLLSPMWTKKLPITPLFNLTCLFTGICRASSILLQIYFLLLLLPPWNFSTWSQNEKFAVKAIPTFIRQGSLESVQLACLMFELELAVLGFRWDWFVRGWFSLFFLCCLITPAQLCCKWYLEWLL